ncbi:hypothetical protein PFNF135_03851 [Plasmodium falciparum NF135/5.C10]|uniref:Tetratricopeptide SHNi-TPR domain-containing protein n=1 Tax=Plasmodium falciparum NF135/5.C10 TaxID=1036726 RepID=W4IE85_PLAFA|nr:hypothetical protein PFNF135_03851 [Plasmodium falciparum NF135/5.C10]
MSEEEVIANDSSNTNVDSDVDEQRELLETRTAQELFDMGRLEFKENKNYDVAAERFSMAVEKKFYFLRKKKCKNFSFFFFFLRQKKKKKKS